MKNYVYKVCHHAISKDDWNATDGLIAMLLRAVDEDEPIELADKYEQLRVPDSVVAFLLDGLLHLCGEEMISMVLLAGKGRLGTSQTAEILRSDYHLTPAFKQRGLKPITTTKPGYYDQAMVLQAFSRPLSSRRADDE